MLRSITVSVAAFCTFFITPVSASYNRPVDVREVVSTSWDLVEVSAQMQATAMALGDFEVARAAKDLHREALDWYAALREIGSDAKSVAPHELPAARDEMVQAYDDLAGHMDAVDVTGSPELRTLWRMTQNRMRSAKRAVGQTQFEDI